MAASQGEHSTDSPRDDVHAQSKEEYSFIRGTLHDKWAQANWEAEAPEILPDEIKRGKKLAQGSFGVVYKGKCRGEIVAIKELSCDIDDDVLEEFRREVAIMSHLRHPNIVLLMGACTQGPRLCIVTEYLPGGDLDKKLEEKTAEFSALKKIKILQDVALAMNWLHCSSPPIIHRDLKPSNIMLTEDGIAKVGDLGLSAIQKKRKIKSYGAGSYLWMAPEALRNQPHSEKIDVYSFAVVMWQVLNWDADPFHEYLESGDLDGLIAGVCDRNERPPIRPEMHTSLAEIMQTAWHGKPKQRPSFGEITMKLDDSLINSAVTNAEAARFWRENWGRVEKNRSIETTKLTVPFVDFTKEFYKFIGEKFPKNKDWDQKYLCLKSIVSERLPNFRDQEVVTLERFALLPKWFGALVRENEKKTILDTMLDIISHPWFHGDIDKDEAKDLLTTHKPKEGKSKALLYLVRLSTSEPVDKNPFTISKWTKEDKIVHQRIQYEEDTKELFISVLEKGEQKRIGSTKGLVDLISIISEKGLIDEPAPRRKYQVIFMPKRTEDLGYRDAGDE